MALDPAKHHKHKTYGGLAPKGKSAHAKPMKLPHQKNTPKGAKAMHSTPAGQVSKMRGLEGSGPSTATQKRRDKRLGGITF